MIATQGISKRKADRDRDVCSVVDDITRNLDETSQHRHKVERMLLSMLMAFPRECFLKVAAVVSKSDFHDPVLRRLFETMRVMQSIGEPITTESIIVACSRNGIVEEIGGENEFRALLMTAPNAAHADFYSKELNRLAISERAYQATIDSAVRLSHKNCNVASELEFLRTLGSNESIGSQILSGRQALDQILKNEESESRVVVEFGVPELDKLIGNGIAAKKLMLLGGRFGKGKSALACQIVGNAIRTGKRSLVFSLEMTVDEINQRILSCEVGIPMTAWKRKRNPNEQRLIEEFKNETDDLWRIDDSPSHSLDSIRNAIQRAILDEGVDLVVIDNIQLIDSGLDSRQPTYVHLKRISTMMKKTAREFDVAVLLLAQLDTDAGKPDREPNSTSWAGGKDIEGDCDIGLMLHQVDENQVTDRLDYLAIATKVRDAKRGRIGVVFDRLYQRFESQPATSTYQGGYFDDFAKR
jgi:replicative DNA helicase